MGTKKVKSQSYLPSCFKICLTAIDELYSQVIKKPIICRTKIYNLKLETDFHNSTASVGIIIYTKQNVMMLKC